MCQQTGISPFLSFRDIALPTHSFTLFSDSGRARENVRLADRQQKRSLLPIRLIFTANLRKRVCGLRTENNANSVNIGTL